MADNTASLVVALSAQLTKFEKDMRDAGIMADKAVNDIEGKFSRMNPKLSPAFGATFLGSFLGTFSTKLLDEALKVVSDIVDRFKELEKVSYQTGIAMKEAFALQEAAKQFKGQAEDVNAAIKTLALQLDEIRRGGDPGLNKLLDANQATLAMSGFTKQTLQGKDAFLLLADIVSGFKDPVQRLAAIRLVGIAEGLLPTLDQGSAKLKEIVATAEKGAPDFERIAAASRAFSDTWKSIAENMTGFFKDQSIAFFASTLTDIAGIFKLIAGTLSVLRTLPLFDIEGTTTAVNYLKGQIAEIETASARMRGKLAGEPAPGTPGAPTTRITVNATGGGSRLPSLAPPSTAADYDRAVKQIEKHTAAMEADAATVGESAFEQEEYRVQLLLSNAAVEQGLPLTAKLNDEIAGLAERAAKAKQALESNQFALQKLNSAGQQLGSALSTAFADAIVDGKALNDVMKSLITTLEKAALNSLVMSFFTPGAGGAASPFASILRGGFQRGTDFAPGGLALVGERGPELVNLPRGSQVIPNDVMRNGGMGSVTAPVTFMIDNRGASVEAVAKMAQVMQEMQATLPLKIVSTIQQARRGRVPGL
jgi:hypothetical protein